MFTKCPKCGENGFERVKRKWWMYFIPQSHLFRCYLCNYSTMDSLGRHPSTDPLQPAGVPRDLDLGPNDVKGMNIKQKLRAIMPYVAIGLLTLSIAFTLISCYSSLCRSPVIAYLRNIPTTSFQDQAVEDPDKNPSEYICAEEQRMEEASLAWEKKRAIEEASLAWERKRITEEARLVSEKEITASPDHHRTFREQESVSIGYMTYVVERSTLSSALKHVSKPDSIFLIAVLAVRNDDKKNRSIPPFRLVNERGVEYATTSKARMRKEVISTSDSLNPDVVKRGVVIFDVPNGHTYKLKVLGGHGAGSDYAFVELSL
jgi:hypothetical protein